MKYVENLQQYWTETYPQLLDTLKNIITDVFEHPNSLNYDSITLFDVVGDKPSFIPQDVWDHLFCKDMNAINMYRQLRNNNPIVYFCEIEGKRIGHFKVTGWFFIFEGDVSYSSLSDYSFQDRFDIMKSYLSPLLSNEKVPVLLNEFKHVFGEQNVWYGQTNLTWEFNGIKGTEGYKRPMIIIYHGDFWITDDFGMKVKIRDGFSFFCTNSSGDIQGNSIYFTALTRDWQQYKKRYVHSHVESEQYLSPRMKKLCRGRNSPVNTILGEFISTPNADNAYGLALAYKNLIEHESSETGPHVRILDALVKNAGSSSNRPMSKGEILKLICDGNINFSASHNENHIEITVTRNDILAYLSSLSEQSGNTFYCSRGGYKKELKLTDSGSSDIDKFVYLFDNRYVARITETDPDNYDFSEMGNPDFGWSSTNLVAPNDETLKSANEKLTGLVNFKLSLTKHVEEIKFEGRVQEEIFGLTKIRRNTNINNIPVTSVEDRLPAQQS